MAGTILFLSDYGLDDEFVGVCHAVMARIAPDVRVIDVTHGVPPQDIRRGAVALAAAAPYAPGAAVLLAIVDPDVGTARRPVAVEAGRTILVGPDNGVLSLAWDELGGPARAFEVTSESVMLHRVSATFHGRDVFAPAAAHLASGLSLEEVGPPVAPDELVRIRAPRPRAGPGRLECEVIAVDRFGNVQLGARPQDLEAAGLADAAELQVLVTGRRSPVRRVRTFDDLQAADLGLMVDSAGRLAVVVNRGSAAEALSVTEQGTVVLGRGGDG